MTSLRIATSVPLGRHAAAWITGRGHPRLVNRGFLVNFIEPTPRIRTMNPEQCLLYEERDTITKVPKTYEVYC
jgi:hypothetical protein